MKVSIASDHAGYELRQKVIKHLEEKGFEVLDGGAPNGTDSYSYVDA
ncbi:MAG: RpiB/LacA/LacB family sugar-phosphate isomerase, partial [Clostridiales bacterium]|nr:RpiB/LacA/LacB family sugar-phosphate isomerase [Clostridiales bacterium]